MAIGTIILPVQAAKITGSFITTSSAIDAGNGAWRLLYDATLVESALWQFIMPANYSGGNITTQLAYTMASAVSTQVNLGVEFMAVSDGDVQDVDTASFDTSNTQANGEICAGTAGHLSVVAVTCSDVDSASNTDLVIVRVTRLSADANDVATGDLELAGASLDYTTT